MEEFITMCEHRKQSYKTRARVAWKSGNFKRYYEQNTKAEVMGEMIQIIKNKEVENDIS